MFRQVPHFKGSSRDRTDNRYSVGPTASCAAASAAWGLNVYFINDTAFSYVTVKTATNEKHGWELSIVK